MPEHGEDGYAGPAELIDGDAVIAVTVTLAGHFDPISGSPSWYGPRVEGSARRRSCPGLAAGGLAAPPASSQDRCSPLG